MQWRRFRDVFERRPPPPTAQVNAHFSVIPSVRRGHDVHLWQTVGNTGHKRGRSTGGRGHRRQSTGAGQRGTRNTGLGGSRIQGTQDGERRKQSAEQGRNSRGRQTRTVQGTSRSRGEPQPPVCTSLLCSSLSSQKFGYFFFSIIDSTAIQQRMSFVKTTNEPMPPLPSPLLPTLFSKKKKRNKKPPRAGGSPQEGPLRALGSGIRGPASERQKLSPRRAASFIIS